MGQPEVAVIFEHLRGVNAVERVHMVVGKLDDGAQVALVPDEETFVDPNEDGASTILVRGILGIRGVIWNGNVFFSLGFT